MSAESTSNIVQKSPEVVFDRIYGLIDAERTRLVTQKNLQKADADFVNETASMVEALATHVRELRVVAHPVLAARRNGFVLVEVQPDLLKEASFTEQPLHVMLTNNHDGTHLLTFREATVDVAYASCGNIERRSYTVEQAAARIAELEEHCERVGLEAAMATQRAEVVQTQLDRLTKQARHVMSTLNKDHGATASIESILALSGLDEVLDFLAAAAPTDAVESSVSLASDTSPAWCGEPQGQLVGVSPCHRWPSLEDRSSRCVLLAGHKGACRFPDAARAARPEGGAHA